MHLLRSNESENFESHDKSGIITRRYKQGAKSKNQQRFSGNVLDNKIIFKNQKDEEYVYVYTHI